MPSPARLLALPGDDLQDVRFVLAFAAPDVAELPSPAEASMEFGDGQRAVLGWLAAPSDATWRDRRLLALASHTYAGVGPYTARLLWGSLLLELQVRPGTAVADARDQEPPLAPDLSLFAVDIREGRAMERAVRLSASGVARPGQFRLDGGAGQVFLLGAEIASGQPCERRLTYPKTGLYIVTLDFLDADGFHVRTCAQQAVEIGGLDEAEGAGLTGRPGRSEATRGSGEFPAPPVTPVRAESCAPATGTAAPGEPQPWLPFHYVRPLWGWLRTYTSPGGTNVARVLASGTYLSVHVETVVGHELWYQTAGHDWIPAAVVETIRPSELRGLELTTLGSRSAEYGADREGVVQPRLLNVRTNPGVRADNPPTRQLLAGTTVSIVTQAHCGDSVWYQIEPAGWVQGSGLRLLPAGRNGRRASCPARAQELPAGWVLAPSLKVWARPGVAGDNTAVDCLARDAMIPILEAHALGSTTWYRIGDDRWVDGTWIAVAQRTNRPMPLGPGDRWLAVSLASQTAVAYEGDRPVYAAAVATGLPATPTPAGLFRTSRRVPAERISGGNPAWGSYYDLEDVPWINHFFGGYALVGTYWHTGFGRPRSHGCVNFSPYDAWWIYGWGRGDISVYIY